MKLLFILLLFCSICYANEDIKFRIDHHIQYRLWFGHGVYDFLDINRSGCDDFGENCKYQDYSAIEKFDVKEDHLIIYKKTSVWFLYNYDDPSNMMLQYAGDRYLYENK